jgi:stage IV sporulation protein FB
MDLDETSSKLRDGPGGPRPWSLRVGTLFGVPVRVHLTFLLLLLWFGKVSQELGRGYLGGVIYILLLFACVVLHELGHAVMARRWGVATREIVLYPFGGVASMDRIPPGRAELSIALAGPAVTAALAGLLYLATRLLDTEVPDAPDELAAAPLLWQMVVANVALLAFNLIPAFPMDGGRALRAGLSLVLGERKATMIATTIGQVFAVLLAVVGIFWWEGVNPFLLLIAFFVFVGASQEASFARSRAAVRGLTAKNAMITRFEKLAPQDTLGRAAQLLLASQQADFPVVDAWGRVAGVLHRSALLAALAAEGGKERAVLDFMDREPAVVRPELPLEEVMRLLQPRPLHPVLVVGDQGLEGMITLENFGELIEIADSLGRSGAIRLRP